MYLFFFFSFLCWFLGRFLTSHIFKNNDSCYNKHVFVWSAFTQKMFWGYLFFWGIDTVFTTTRFLPHNVNTKGLFLNHVLVLHVCSYLLRADPFPLSLTAAELLASVQPLATSAWNPAFSWPDCWTPAKLESRAFLATKWLDFSSQQIWQPDCWTQSKPWAIIIILPSAAFPMP